MKFIVVVAIVIAVIYQGMLRLDKYQINILGGSSKQKVDPYVWQYQQDKEVAVAQVLSSTLVESAFQSNTKIQLKLKVSKNISPEKSFSVFSVENDKFKCGIYSGCTVLILFDNKHSITPKMLVASNLLMLDLYIENHDAFLEQLVKRKKMIAELPLESGVQKFEFNIENLDL